MRYTSHTHEQRVLDRVLAIALAVVAIAAGVLAPATAWGVSTDQGQSKAPQSCKAAVAAKAGPAYTRALATYKALHQPKPSLTAAEDGLCNVQVRVATKAPVTGGAEPDATIGPLRYVYPSVQECSIRGASPFCVLWSSTFSVSAQYDGLWSSAQDGGDANSYTCDHMNAIFPYSVNNPGECRWPHEAGGWLEPTPYAQAEQNFVVNYGVWWFSMQWTHTIDIYIYPNGNWNDSTS